jgi:hypothetical protein
LDDKGVGVEEDGLSKEGEVPHVELGAGGAPLAQFGGVLRPEVVLPARDAWAHHLVACDLGHLANLPGSAAQQLTDASVDDRGDEDDAPQLRVQHLESCRQRQRAGGIALVAADERHNGRVGHGRRPALWRERHLILLCSNGLLLRGQNTQLRGARRRLSIRNAMRLQRRSRFWLSLLWLSLLWLLLLLLLLLLGLAVVTYYRRPRGIPIDWTLGRMLCADVAKRLERCRQWFFAIDAEHTDDEDAHDSPPGQHDFAFTLLRGSSFCE